MVRNPILENHFQPFEPFELIQDRWFQAIWKISVKLDQFPKFWDENKKPPSFCCHAKRQKTVQLCKLRSWCSAAWLFHAPRTYCRASVDQRPGKPPFFLMDGWWFPTISPKIKIWNHPTVTETNHLSWMFLGIITWVIGKQSPPVTWIMFNPDWFRLRNPYVMAYEILPTWVV